MNLLPHDHMMKALIGIHTGREDFILWRRSGEGIEASGVNCLFEGNVAELPVDGVHSLTNPLPRLRAESTFTTVISLPPIVISGTRKPLRKSHRMARPSGRCSQRETNAFSESPRAKLAS